jgi:DNA-binding MarR family transcriptional regulator
MSTAYSHLSKRLDSALGYHGISFSEYMVLHHLSSAKEHKLKRIDLAEKMSITASGITRMIGPMERIGLVEKEANTRDARISYVKLTKAGAEIFEDASTSIGEAARHLLGNLKVSDVSKGIALMNIIYGSN